MQYRHSTGPEPRLPRRSHSVTGWMRALFLDDLGLKLLSLAIAVALWFAVTGQRVSTTVTIPHVPLTFRTPADMEISNDPPKEVDVTITGSKQEIDRLNARDLVAVVDLANYAIGDRVVQLSFENVVLKLPEGVRLDEVQPKSLPLRLEQRVEKELVVKPKLTGKPASGFELRAIAAIPEKVRVRGPLSRVRLLSEVTTEAIDISGLAGDKQFAGVASLINDGKVTVLDAVLTLNVTIGEERIERIIQGVKVMLADGRVARPSQAAVVLFGDKSAINSLSASELQLLLSEGMNGTELHLRLPPGMAGLVTLRSSQPAVFSAPN